jgi:hypothetical protein
MILRRITVFVACALWAGGALAASDKPKPAAPEPTAEPVSGDPQMTTASYV